MPRQLCSNTSIIPEARDIAAHQAETTLLIANKIIMAAAAPGAVAQVQEVWKTTLSMEISIQAPSLATVFFSRRQKY